MRSDFIQCRFNVFLASKDQVKKHLQKLISHHEFEDYDIDEYPKFPGSYMATFGFKLESQSQENAVYLLLKLCNKIARDEWTVNGPYESGDFSFGCCLNNKRDEPVKWAYMSIGDA